MFDLIFIVGITVLGVAATVWLLQRDKNEDGFCGGCACRYKKVSTEVPDIKTTE
ncbi:MAG: hypothetical protein JSW52_02145 [Candidatus Coatesbacteria bacterium]|nr:MAG: hypothetical protein JSW52_02145 [Candidatus Coatesbacteria bacterium]